MDSLRLMNEEYGIYFSKEEGKLYYDKARIPEIGAGPLAERVKNILDGKWNYLASMYFSPDFWSEHCFTKTYKGQEYKKYTLFDYDGLVALLFIADLTNCERMKYAEAIEEVNDALNDETVREFLGEELLSAIKEAHEIFYNEEACLISAVVAGDKGFHVTRKTLSGLSDEHKELFHYLCSCDIGLVCGGLNMTQRETVLRDRKRAWFENNGWSLSYMKIRSTSSNSYGLGSLEIRKP